jgi:cellulose synthase/poly-beta-1,6-N-acetylglucosamine synthase-like glycosyltransferase
MPGSGDQSDGQRAVRSERARAHDRVTDLRARLGPPQLPPQLGDLLVSQGALTPENLERALEEQRRTAGRLGEILVARGYVHRLDVYRALSDAWGIPHVDLSRHVLDADLCAELGIDLADLASMPWVPLVREHDTLVVATTERPSPALEAHVRAYAGSTDIAWMVTTDWDVRNAVLRSFGAELTRRASSDLAARAPDDSASRVLTRRQAVVLLAALGALVAAGIAAPLTTANGIFLALNLAVVCNVGFKALSILAGFVRRARRVVTAVPDIPDADLPRYTVLVPAFGEANVIADLVEHLGHLDYPRDRLEVLLLLEEVDRPTIEAAMGSGLPAFVRIVVVPDGQPRTKPKACNVGLNFAHGEFLVIYDAEDRPAPDQLRRAVAAFRAAPPEMICLQARLSYWNVDENALTRFFTLEYAHWFDLMLDGLAALHLPIPLGGTSNHFRVEPLRAVGAWDPHNVTEDADLGLRVAAQGMTVSTLASTTLEEACCRPWPWIKQRTRWIKGYMQTALVHTRHPVRFVRMAGLHGTLTLVFLVAGTPLAFLAAPVLWIACLAPLVVGHSPQLGFTGLDAATLAACSLVIGNSIMVGAAVVAALLRRRYDLALWALLLPAYWVLHSIAAWRALGQLVTNPSKWEKTPHGLTRHATPAAGWPAPPLPAHHSTSHDQQAAA